MVMKKDIESVEALFTKLSMASKKSDVNEKIARYVEKNYKSFVFLTAVEAAKLIGVSQGSVSRFCIAMGYKGYNEFSRYLQKIVSDEITPYKRLSIIDKMGNSQNSLNILNREIQNTSELKDIIQSVEYKNVVQVLCKSSEISFLSYRMSATLIPYAGYILNKLRPNVHQVNFGSFEWDNIDFEDNHKITIFTIMLPRYSTILLEKLKQLHEAQFRIVAITDSRLSPVTALADYTIVVPITVASVFDVYSTPMTLINLMMRDVAKGLPNVDSRLKKIENQNRKNDVFES